MTMNSNYFLWWGVLGGEETRMCVNLDSIRLFNIGILPYGLRFSWLPKSHNFVNLKCLHFGNVHLIVFENQGQTHDFRLRGWEGGGSKIEMDEVHEWLFTCFQKINIKYWGCIR